MRQAIDQLEGHLGKEITADVLVDVDLPAAVRDDGGGRGQAREAARIVADEVRPAMRRLLACLHDELLPGARPDGQVGIRFVPGGAEGYRAAVRRHTTTELTAEQIHQIGLDVLAGLRAEWAELGGRVLGTSEVPQILARLRDDPALRFTDSAQIVATVTDALHRAEAALNDWFPATTTSRTARSRRSTRSRRPTRRWPTGRPRRGALLPGAHCVLTVEPAGAVRLRVRGAGVSREYAGSTTSQIATNQTLAGLPDFRRYLDAEVCGFVEGWGLYCERLADEMGLYTSDLQRLGMLSFDAWRACRLVVDTGLHHYGWSRSRAIQFMWENTATTRANVISEVDRYIGWPGQAYNLP